MAVTVATSELVGTMLEAGVYGIYFTVLIQTLCVFHTRHREGRNIWWLLVTAVVIFALVTAHLVLDIDRVLNAYTAHLDVPNAAITYYNDLSVQRRLAKTSTYMILTLVSDAIIVYRAFVVWGRSYATALFPFILFLADIGLMVWELWSLSQWQDGIPLMQTIIAYRIKYFYIVTLVLNVTCTFMIAWKIWYIHNKVANVPAVSGPRFTGIMAAIVESAAFYTCFLMTLIGTSIVRSPATWIVLDAICPIIGMVFSTVMVRASRDYHTNTFITTDAPISAILSGADPYVLPTSVVTSSPETRLETAWKEDDEHSGHSELGPGFV